MPWEETDEYIRSGHRSSDDFQEGSFRTITIDAEKGIKAVIGKPVGKDTTEVQSYLFDKDKWTLEEAKAWFQEHKSETLKFHFGLPLTLQVLTEKADPDARIFAWSMPARYYMKPGRMVIYGTSLVAGATRKGDVYSREEVMRGARSLIGGPIELFNHTWDTGVPHWLTYPDNVVLDAEEVDGRIEYIAGVQDTEVQGFINSKEINHVSINAICRYVPADDPRQCNGLILNGFCLLHRTSLPASVGTCVKVWNSFSADAHRLRSLGKPDSLETEFARGLKMEGNKKNKPPGKQPGSLTAQGQPPVTAVGPAAGIPEKSTEDRVRDLESKVSTIETAILELKTMIETLIKTASGDTKPGQAEGSKVKKTEAEWDTEYINNLPDSSFAFIEGGGEKDKEGKTKPRSLRHLPFKNAEGNIDRDHLQNALGRLPQTDLSDQAKAEAKNKLCAAVKAWNKAHPDDTIESEVCDVHPEQKTEQAGEPGGSPPENGDQNEVERKGPRERFMSHYGLTDEQMDQVLEWIGEDVYKLLPPPGTGRKTEQMTTEEIKARIAELSKQREGLWNEMWPQPEPGDVLSDEKRAELQSQIDVIDAEIKALEAALAEKMIESPGESKTENVAANVRPVESEEQGVFLTEAEIIEVFTNKRFFTPALKVNGILALIEEKKKEAERNG